MRDIWERNLEVWRGWWLQCSYYQKVFPMLLLGSYWVVLHLLVGLLPENILGSLIPVILYYGGPTVRPLFQFLLPFFLTAILYDSMRYYADLIRGEVHVREPYEFDKRFFGISSQGKLLTPNEWLQNHTHPILDVICGFAYLIFIPVFLASAAYFRFWKSRKGTTLMSFSELKALSPQVMWAFFWVNLIGYSTYYWYPASPPWYVDLYGFGPARLDIPPNQAGCIRFDQALGTHFFPEWYGRSADVHGAIPSLHIAYPLQAFLYALQFGTLRVFTFTFYLLMCFSAVYLNHHYVLDILWGSFYALVVYWTTNAVWKWRLVKKDATAANSFLRNRILLLK